MEEVGLYSKHFVAAHVLSDVSLLSNVSSKCTCRDVRSSAEVPIVWRNSMTSRIIDVSA